MKGCSHLAEATDEPAIKTREPQEPTEFGPAGWLGPLQHRLGFLGVGADVTPLNDESQEFYGRGVELAFLRLQEETVLEETSQDPTDMLVVLVEGTGKKIRMSSR